MLRTQILMTAALALVLSCATAGKHVPEYRGEGGVSMMIQVHSMSGIVDLSWKSDGTVCAAVTRDGKILLWSPDGRLLKTIHAGSKINSVALSPDGKTIAHHQWTDGGDKLILRGIDGAVRFSFDARVIPGGLSYNKSGTRLYCTESNSVLILDSGGRLIRKLDPYRDVYRASHLADGGLVAVIVGTRNNMGFNFTKGVNTIIYRADGTIAKLIYGEALYSTDGINLLSVSEDILKVHDGYGNHLETVTLPDRIQMMSGSAVPERYPLISPDGKLIAYLKFSKLYICGRDGTVRHALQNAVFGPGLSFSPDGTHLVSYGDSQERNADILGIINAHSGRCAATILTQAGESKTALNRERNDALAMIAENGKALLDVRNGRAVLWDLNSLAPRWNEHLRKTGQFAGLTGYGPSLNPDGSSFVYHMSSGEPGVSGSSIMDMSGKKITVSREFVREGPFKREETGFSPDGKTIINLYRSPDASAFIKFWTRDGYPLRSIPLGKNHVNAFSLSPDGSSIAVVTDTRAEIRDFGGAVRLDFPLQPYCRESVAFSPDWKFLYTGHRDYTISAYDMRDGKFGRRIVGGPPSVKSEPFTLFKPVISPNGTRMILHGHSGRWNYYNLVFLAGPGWKQLNGFHEAGKNDHAFIFSPDGKAIASFSFDHKVVNFWDGDGNHTRQLDGFPGTIQGISFMPDGRHLLTRLFDTTMKITDLQTGNSISLFENAGDWVIFSPDGYFDGSPGCGRLVSPVSNMKAFGVDQYALKYNRPDILGKRMGFGDTGTIDWMYKRYAMRLNKYGLTENDLAGGLHAPEAVIEKADQDFNANNGKYVDLSFRLGDGSYTLARYNIYINEVPLFGDMGKPVSGSGGFFSERVELIPGKNKIEVSCVNARGAESLRAMMYAEYRDRKMSDLYFVGFGVSKYRDEKLNLRYAHKDASDLAGIFGRMKDKYSRVHIKTFLDEEVTRSAVGIASDFLKTARPADTIVVFAAGHGLYDIGGEPVFYYLTHDADLGNLKNTAISFELLEGLMEKTAARNRLYLLDACESGEYDESPPMFSMTEGARGIRPRTTRALRLEIMKKRGEAPPPDYKTRYLYNNLKRRTGAIVLSSSKGGRLSYESDTLRNGLFSHAIAEGIQGSADFNGDRMVTTDELRDFVAREVPRISGNKQHPTVDRDNLYIKISLPRVR